MCVYQFFGLTKLLIRSYQVQENIIYEWVMTDHLVVVSQIVLVLDVVQGRGEGFW